MSAAIIIHEHRALLRAAALRSGLSWHDAEDAVSEVCEHCLKRGLTIDVTKNSVGWAITVLKNLIKDRRRHHMAVKRGAGAMHVPIDDALELGCFDTPAAALDRAELRLALQSCGADEALLMPEGGRPMTPAERKRAWSHRQKLKRRLRPFLS